MTQIVVGVDGSPESKAALVWALDEARLRGVGLRVVSAWHDVDLSAVDASGFVQPEVESALRELGERKLADVLADVNARRFGVEVESEVVDAPPAEALLGASDGADLLVVGSRGRGGFIGLLLGSVSHQCAHHASCPVAIVRKRPHGEPRIVVGVDGSPAAAAALEWAANEARLRGSSLLLVHVWSLPAAAGGIGFPAAYPPLELLEKEAESLVDRVADEAAVLLQGIALTRSAIRGMSAYALIEAARDAELLVVGSRGLGGFKELLLGSVSHQCAAHAPCPVVIVREK